MSEVVVLRADRWVDIDAGKVRSPGVVVVLGNRIAAVNPSDLPAGATQIDLGDVTLLPGLMDMKLNFFLGKPGSRNGLPAPMRGVQDDPVYRAYRAAMNARTTLLAGFTTVRWPTPGNTAGSIWNYVAAGRCSATYRPRPRSTATSWISGRTKRSFSPAPTPRCAARCAKRNKVT